MRSEQIKTGVERTPNRSLLYALGYTDEELARPLIGVVSSYNEIVPGHMGLDKIAEAVKAGIRAAGGTPVMFPAVAVCDGIAMGHVGMKYSLVTRDLIADSTEAMVMAHQFDGLVMIPNCDKNVPGLLMAAARLNIPTIFCSGGPMLAGRLKDGRRTCLSHMFEAVGAYHAGKLDEAGVADYTENACPTCGSCSGMYTANSMNCLTEAIGMALRGNGTIPAVYSARLRLAKQTGMKIMEPSSFNNLNIVFLVFVAGCMAIGFVAGEVGANKWAVSSIIPFLKELPPTLGVLCSYLAGVVTNLLLTPFAATVAFTPAFGELGVQMGVNPLPLFYAFEYGLDQYFFPYEGVMFLYIFTTGCVTLKHVIPTMIARCIVAGAFIAVIAIPYWTFIGIM